MRALLLLAGLALAPAAGAADGFAGRYDHATEGPPDPVWTLRDAATGTRMERHDGLELPVRELDAGERGQLWARLDWPADTAATVRCVGWADEPGPFSQPLFGSVTSVICHVPASARARIDWLRDNASDWIYYDTGLGVAELRRFD
ncbi:MAG TPA: hypothetical protein VIG68_07600 [Lysobacter sp.]